MLQRLSRRMNQTRGQGGFTLIELLVVIIIIGILLAIAIPSYLKFRDRANKSAAQANVRASIPAVEAYYADNDTYAGATLSYLQSTYDQALDVSKYTLTGVSSSTYCVSSVSGDKVWKKAGPAAPLATGACT